MTIIIPKTNKPLPKRHDLDVYLTPRWAVEDALRFIPLGLPIRKILDPCAGDGIWGKVAVEKWGKAGRWIEGVDIRADLTPEYGSAYNGWHTGDFLLLQPDDQYDLALCNPPYKQTEQFIRHSLKFLREGGYALFLLRLAFLGGQERAKSLFTRIPPKSVIVQGTRIPFAGDSPHETHMYVIWEKGYRGETALKWTWGK